MTWTRLSDDFTDRPKMLSVSRSARLLHVEALVWCNRMLTDGWLPAPALSRMTDAEDVQRDIAELVGAGLWHGVDDGWVLNWADQESAEHVRARRAYQAEKQKRFRDRKASHERGDHSKCDARFCNCVTGNTAGHATGDETSGVTPTRPDPSRPKDRDREGVADADDAKAPPRRALRSAGRHRFSGGDLYCGVCQLPPGHPTHVVEAGAVRTVG